MAATNKTKPTNFYRWATNIVNDPTTLQDNRTAITVALQDNGWVPFGVKPARQKMNQSLYELGRWSEWNFHLASQYFEVGKVRILPGALSHDGATSLVVVNGAGIGGILDNFTTSTIKLATSSIATLTKDQSLTWAEGNGGLRGFTTPMTDKYLYLFLISTPAGVTDLATDTVITGTNIKANSAILSAGYDYLRHIATLSYVNDGGTRWRPFVYSRDDMILFDEAGSGSQSFIDSSTSWVTKTLSDGGGNTFPTENTITKINLTHTSTSPETAAVKSYTGITEADEPNTKGFVYEEDSVLYTMDQTESKFRMKSAGGASASVQISPLGYKNPAVN